MVGLRSQEGQGKEATGGLKTHAGVCNKLPNFSVPPDRESICGHHILNAFALVGSNYSHFSVLGG